jgi:hypothetical protein
MFSEMRRLGRNVAFHFRELGDIRPLTLFQLFDVQFLLVGTVPPA